MQQIWTRLVRTPFSGLDQVTEQRVPAAATAPHTAKRGLDVCVAGLILLVTSPLLLLIAALVRLTSAGPVLFRQTRIGRFGQPFTCYKFRTMYQNTDPSVHRSYVEAYAQGRVVPGADSRRPYKLAHDPRVSPVGRILRRTSLDELPQLFNVVKGDMSLVGPRPDVPYSVALYKDWHKMRLAVKPGITGWWQIRGRGRVTFDEMMRLDCEYVQNQSFWLDLYILCWTPLAVLKGKGAA